MSTSTVEELLSEAGWLRRLATCLADESVDADDIVQEARIAAWQRQPDESRPLRPWLAKVIRDTAKMRRRSHGRRLVRDGAAVSDDEIASPEDLLAQAQLHRLLVDLVLELEEPYRATILARFVDGRSCAEIARARGVPEGTVRWRLKEGLDRLRNQLDSRAKKRQWSFGAIALWFGKGKVVAAACAVLLVLLFRGTTPTGHDEQSPVHPVAPDAERQRAAAVSENRAKTPSWLLLADSTTRAIAGRVVNETGSPIAGARVDLQSFASAIDNATEAHIITRADGTFRFQPRWSARYIVAASAVDRAPASTWVDPRAPQDASNPSALVLVLSPCTRSAVGSVSDAGGGPIVGATIRQLPAGVPGQFGSIARTDSTGRFEQCLAHGETWLDIGADGYEHVLRRVDGEGRQLVDVDLVPEAILTGKVVDSTTNEGIAGVQIAAWPAVRESRGASDRVVVSDADGNFVIDGLSAARYQVTAWDLTHARAAIDDVVVEVGVPTAPLRVRMDPGITLKGVVRDASSSIAGARVALTVNSVASLRHLGGTSASTFDAVTDSAGRFTLNAVPVADSVMVQVHGFRVLDPVTINTRTVSTLTINVEPLASVRGRVVRNEQGVPNADVLVVGGGRSVRVRTDSSGRFLATGLQQGPVQLSATSHELGVRSTRVVAAIAPSSEESVLVLDGAASIEGVVVDQSGKALANLVVVAIGDDDRRTTVSASNGGFAFRGVATGKYSFEVRPSIDTPPLAWFGNAPTTDVRTNDEKRGSLTLSVTRTVGEISGRVLDGRGPVADAIVRLGPGRDAVTRTNGEGEFHLRSLGDGPFTLDASVGSGSRAHLDGVKGDATDVILQLEKPATLEGVLTGFRDTRVWIRRVEGRHLADARAETRSQYVDGEQFVFSSLSAGRYVVGAVAADHASASGAVSVEEGGRASIALKASKTRLLSGRVLRFPEGTPESGLRCAVAAASGDVLPPSLYAPGTQQTVTDTEGRFTFDAAAMGSVVVHCAGNQSTSSGATIVAEGERATVYVVRQPMGSTEVGLELESHRVPAIVRAVTPQMVRVGFEIGDRLVGLDELDVGELSGDAIRSLLRKRPSHILIQRGQSKLSFSIPRD